jgi:hypothetical protein
VSHITNEAQLGSAWFGLASLALTVDSRERDRKNSNCAVCPVTSAEERKAIDWP